MASMKPESDNTQTAVTPQPNVYAASTQWGASHIPIDPALQQQPQHPTTTPYAHYQPYAGHYPQANYATYHQYVPPTAASTSQQQIHSHVQPIIPARQNTIQPSTSVDTSDIATLNDALGSAGVDLRAEEETLQRSYDHHQTYRPYEDRSRKQPSTPSFELYHLGTSMRNIGTQHKITKIPDDSINYLALSLRARLQDLITEMIKVSHHRTDSDFDRPASFYEDGTPMWSIVVRSDIAKQLAVLEKVEREEEMKVRRDRKERTEMAAAHAAALAAQASGGGVAPQENVEDGEGGNAKKKRKKEGPGVTARNMSEDVRKKMSNAVASQAAGLGGKYAWMNAANASVATPKIKPGPSTASGATPSTPATTTAPATGTAGGSWARPYLKAQKGSSNTGQATEEENRTIITMRDALFVVEKERGHGGGRGAARGWV